MEHQVKEVKITSCRSLTKLSYNTVLVLTFLTFLLNARDDVIVNNLEVRLSASD